MHILPILWYCIPVLLGVATKTCIAQSETPTPSNAPNPDWHMDLYIPDGVPEGQRDDIEKEARDDQTYLAAYSEAHTGLANPGSYATNTQIAENHFRWLEANVEDKTKLYSKKKWLLVAVFYDPENHVYFASTVPRGLRKQAMEQSGEEKAPAWWYHASQDNKVPKPQVHAEDSVYFSYESTVPFSYYEDRYPTGSFIAAFGAQRDQSLEYYIVGPKSIPLCVGAKHKSGKVPSCRDVAQKLGVNYGRPRANVADAAASTGDGDYDDNDEYDDKEDYNNNLTKEDWLAIDCKELTSQQKRSLAMNGGHIIIGKRNVTCPSPVPLSLDYQNYPIPTSLSTPEATWLTANSKSTSATMTITTPTSSPSTLSISVVSSVSCYAHFDDPDANDNNQYCVCNTSRTESFLPSGSLYPCSYSTLPPQKRDDLRTTTPSDTSTITVAQTMASVDVPMASVIAAY
ncbi:hypothetical protein F4678DRAFT_464149 [Xylaria arbuscula]|nr:hypothetical protein F4678DRAFT_464149 [Xylaria arbuscula]